MPIDKIPADTNPFVWMDEHGFKAELICKALRGDEYVATRIERDLFVFDACLKSAGSFDVEGDADLDETLEDFAECALIVANNSAQLKGDLLEWYDCTMNTDPTQRVICAIAYMRMIIDKDGESVKLIAFLEWKENPTEDKEHA